MQNYTYSQIRNTDGTRISWWEVIFINPLAYRLTWLFANYTRFTPNQITIMSFILGILSAYFFIHGKWPYLVIGAFLFELSYIVDCIDGRIARLKRLESKFGAFLDTMVDITKYFAIVICLIYGQYSITKDESIFLLGYAFIFLEMMSMTGIHSGGSNYNTNKEGTHNIMNNRLPLIAGIKKRIDPGNRLTFIPLSATEAEVIAFFIAPIIMNIKLGMIIAIIILFANILISIIFNLLIKGSDM